MYPESLEILTNPNPLLRRESVPVDPAVLSTPEFKAFLERLFDIMLKTDGIGIAAPQVGVAEQICIISNNGKNHQVLINPNITWMSNDAIPLTEGCLSVPGIFGSVMRPKGVHIKALNEKGEKIKIQAKGWLSRVIQHELDHLDGVLFIDRAETIERESGETL